MLKFKNLKIALKMGLHNKLKYLHLLKEKEKINARKDIIAFAKYIMPEYDARWFHIEMGKYLNEIAFGRSKNLMQFLPPQNGKSQLVSRLLPAFLLGINPNLRIAICSYSSDLANSFCKDVQNIILSDKYKELFPETRIKEKGGANKDAVKNRDYFEVIGYKGYVKAVGVGGSLTGRPVDVGIIDDPFKDRQEAYSQTIREHVWGWFLSVFRTRLHANSISLMTFTRWHEDDIAGRILDVNNPNYDSEYAKSFKVLVIQGLKEPNLPYSFAESINDPRSIGESLWEEKHTSESYNYFKRVNPQMFNALIQQRPTAAEGNIIKREHIEVINERELPFNPSDIIPDFFIDGAYTNLSKNDETAVCCAYYHKPNGKLYILNVSAFHKNLSEFLAWFEPYAKSMYKKGNSGVYIEPKASGEDMIVMLREFQYGLFNTIKIPNKVVSIGKMARVQGVSPLFAAGRIVFVQGEWNSQTIEQLTSFPNALHDDRVDAICYSAYHYMINEDMPLAKLL